MGTLSSGYYSIDADYNIIGFNDTAKQIYPTLTTGVKCYQVLMGLDSPCPVCPVFNGIHGPKTYLDPIRHIYETVDAVEIPLSDGTKGHALVFSTVAEGERLAGSIPTGESSLRLLGAINLLSSKYIAVFSVNLTSQRISVYRCDSFFENDRTILTDNALYPDSCDAFVAKYAFPEESRSLRESLDLETVRKRLKDVPSFKVHCKLNLGATHYYCVTIARNGEGDNFYEIVVAIACEDDDVNNRRIYEKQLQSLLSSIGHVPGYFHLDLTANRILKVGGTSAFVGSVDFRWDVDTLMRSMAAYILREQDRQDFLQAYSLEPLREAYAAGKVEIIRESKCNYDDNIARWSRYTLRLFANPVHNHLEGVFYGEDITQVKEAYETQSSIVQALSSNYLDVLLIHPREKTVSLIKQDGFLSKMLGQDVQQRYSYEALLGGYIRMGVHPDDREMMVQLTQLPRVLDELSRKDEYTGNYRILYHEEVHYYQFRFIKHQESGIIVLGLLNVDDIVSAEIQHQRTLQEALQEANRANLEKSRFLARMSHDMRTPLNGILGILEIDKKHADDVEYLKENRKKAITVTNHLVCLINDVLDMAKIEEGSLVLSHEPFSILQDAAEATVLINLQAQEYGIQTKVIRHSWDSKLNYIYGSPLHLRRALMNIYSNCIKYNRKGGSITTDVQVLSYDEQTVTFQWTITDTGIGMRPEFLKHIFEPFVQENADARSVYQGTGLGMSISKAIIEKMGGTLEVRSQLDVGSTFVATIPFQRAGEQDVLHTEPKEIGSIAGMRLLLVEDNDLNRDIAQTLLEDEGAAVTTAVNGLEAVNLIRDLPKDSFDLILMDVMMPVMDGYTATKTLRQMGCAIPILAMTANAFAEDVRQSLEAGMNAHIAKPLDLNVMLQTISRFRQ